MSGQFIYYNVEVDQAQVAEAVALFEFMGGNSSDALRVAINKTAPKIKTLASRRIRDQVRLTASYVGEKLEISKATRANLGAAIRTPSRGLLLTKYSTDPLVAGEKVSWLKPPLVPPLGIRVKVKPGGAAKRVGGDSDTVGQPFYMVLRNSGALGIAARRRSAGNKGGRLKVFHGPSLSQVFNDVRQEVLPQAGQELTAQLLDAMRYLLTKQFPPEAD